MSKKGKSAKHTNPVTSKSSLPDINTISFSDLKQILVLAWADFVKAPLFGLFFGFWWVFFHVFLRICGKNKFHARCPVLSTLKLGLTSSCALKCCANIVEHGSNPAIIYYLPRRLRSKTAELHGFL